MREVKMLLSELVRSCSHEKVAEAAVASIGPGFRRLIEEAARDKGLGVGAFSASLVRSFAYNADEQDWSYLAAQLAGKDMPILAGLRHVLETMLEIGDAEIPAGIIQARRAQKCAPFGCTA